MEILFSEEKQARRQQKVFETRGPMNVFLDNGLHAQFGRLVTGRSAIGIVVQRPRRL